MKISLYKLSVILIALVSPLQSAELIRKNLERRIFAQEVAQKNLLNQMAELALKTIDTSQFTAEEIEELKKKLIEAGEKGLKGQPAQTTHGRHNSI
jgi:hypothetical protein